MTIPQSAPDDELGKQIQTWEDKICELNAKKSEILERGAQETSKLQSELSALEEEVKKKQREASELMKCIQAIKSPLEQGLVELKREINDAKAHIEQLRKDQAEQELKDKLVERLTVLRGQRAKAKEIVELLKIDDRTPVLESIEGLYQAKQNVSEATRQHKALTSELDQKPPSQLTPQELKSLMSQGEKVNGARKEFTKMAESSYDITLEKLLSVQEQNDLKLRTLRRQIDEKRGQIQQVTYAKELSDRQDEFIRQLESDVTGLLRQMREYPPLVRLIGEISRWCHKAFDL